MAQIGHEYFIRVLNVRNPLDWVPGLEVRTDGIWVVPARNDDDCTPEERACLSEHPENDLSKPALPFPCDHRQLDRFLLRLGMPLEVFIGDKWHPGQDLIKEYGLQNFQLFDLLKDGVRARTITGLEVINEDVLERQGKESLAELSRIEYLKEGAAQSGSVITGHGHIEMPPPKRSVDEIEKDARFAFEKQPQNVLVIPAGCEAISYSLSYEDNNKRKAAILRAVGFLYKSSDVIKYVWDHDIKSLESSLASAKEEQLKPAAAFATSTEKHPGHGIPQRRKDFITEQELLARWPSIDLGELLELIEKSVPVGTYFGDEFLEKHGRYRFHAWHPLEYRPIKLTEFISNPPQKYDDVPFEINGIRELYPHISKCLFSIEQIEKLEKSFPGLQKNETVKPDTLPSPASKEEREEEAAIPVDVYIQKRLDEKIDYRVIAVELCDENGPFKLSHADCAKILRIGDCSINISHDAWKKRGRRAVEDGKELMQKQRKSSP
ncbi:MAG: hypothetical protein K4571_00815 [Deltaproteobacteria bacterium]